MPTDTPTPPPLEVLLQSLRRQRNEIQLTQCLSNLAKVDVGIGTGLARALLVGASKDQVAGQRAAELLQHLPTTCWWRAEVQALGDPRRARRSRPVTPGRIDWRVEAQDGEEAHPPFLLGIEVKIEAPLANPLEQYYEDLERLQAGAWGLLLLARNRPPGIELLDANQYERWLGVALWQDVIANLILVQPSDGALASVWPSFLRVLSGDDDLGAAPITLDDLLRGGSKRRLIILAQNARDIVQTAAKQALRRRPLGGSARTDLLFVKSNNRLKNAAALCLYTNKKDQRPAIELALRVVDAEVHLTSRVRPAPLFRLKHKANAHQRRALARLQRLEPAYRSEGSDYVRDRTLQPGNADLRDTVSEAMTHEVREVIRTGFLDYDL